MRWCFAHVLPPNNLTSYLHSFQIKSCFEAEDQGASPLATNVCEAFKWTEGHFIVSGIFIDTVLMLFAAGKMSLKMEISEK